MLASALLTCARADAAPTASTWLTLSVWGPMLSPDGMAPGSTRTATFFVCNGSSVTRICWGW